MSGSQTDTESAGTWVGLHHTASQTGTHHDFLLSIIIGLGIFLLVVGAVLTWAVSGRVPGIDLHMIGIIMMVGGVLAVLVGFLVPNGDAYSATRTSTVGPATGGSDEKVDVAAH